MSPPTPKNTDPSKAKAEAETSESKPTTKIAQDQGGTKESTDPATGANTKPKATATDSDDSAQKKSEEDAAKAKEVADAEGKAAAKARAKAEEKAAQEAAQEAANHDPYEEADSTPTEEELDRIDPVEGQGDMQDTVQPTTAVPKAIAGIVAALEDKKDNFIIYGYDGIVIHLSDLREVVGK